ncbi:MAG: penicillin-binding protein 2 [candidate division WWE3 bacterium]|nr:penicillin-binding protein 2 [candidate division WWE3 bacterium]
MPRHKILFIFFIIGLSVVLVRLFKIQIIDHIKYSQLAFNQHFMTQEIAAPRGDIKSSDGFLLAGNLTKYLVYGEPKKITDAAKTTEILMPYLFADLYKPALMQRNISLIKNNELDIKYALSRQDLYWVALVHQIDLETKKQIENLGIPGIGFRPEGSRFYPEPGLATDILGMVGQAKNGDPRGYFGVEGYYDGDLRGRPGEVSQEQNAFGQPIVLGNYQEIAPIPGETINLTINRSIQYMLEQGLIAGLRKYGADSVTGVIINPGSGEILAISSKYKGANSEASISGVPRNAAIASNYEPGSVIKPLTLASALDQNLITPDTIYDDIGPVNYSTHWVDNWDLKHHGKITMTQVLELSNNLGAAWVGLKLGASSLHDYLLKFGLGELSGIDLQGETSGIIRNLADWRDIDTATASFGQGISATPLQVAAAFSVFANGGNLIRPHIVSGSSTPVRRVIAETTAATMTKMLTSAVKNGESKYFNLKNYVIAGKTGTAQIAVNGSYDPKQSNATFVGYFPNDPKFVMLVRLERPTTSIYAAETAVPLWMSIAQELALNMHIAPDTGL